VLEARVTSAWIDQVYIAELGNIAQALEILGVYKGQYVVGDVDIAPDRIADGLAFLC
jgi:hypothetical protein